MFCDEMLAGMHLCLLSQWFWRPPAILLSFSSVGIRVWQWRVLVCGGMQMEMLLPLYVVACQSTTWLVWAHCILGSRSLICWCFGQQLFDLTDCIFGMADGFMVVCWQKFVVNMIFPIPGVEQPPELWAGIMSLQLSRDQEIPWSEFPKNPGNKRLNRSGDFHTPTF